MSTTRRPARPPARGPVRRPHPRGVYWRRRAMVLGTAVLLVVAAVDLVNGDGGGDGGDNVDDTVQQVVTQPRTTPSTPSAPTTRKPRTRPSASPSATPTPTPEPTPEPPPPPAEPEGECADSDIVVRPGVGEAVAGSRVGLTLTLSTREAEACTWTVSAEHLAYKILATDIDIDDDGNDDLVDVWTSAECPDLVPETTVVVRRALDSTLELAWNGRASSRDCPDSMEHVDPGAYAVEASAIGGEPSDVVPFTLLDPAEIEAEEAAEAAKTEKAEKAAEAKKAAKAKKAAEAKKAADAEKAEPTDEASPR